MAFKLQIKRGATNPGIGTLAAGELGYNTVTKKLYIGNGPGEIPTEINETIEDLSGITISETSPIDAKIGDLWWNSSSEFNGLFIYYMYLDADENDEDEEIYQWIQIGTSESGISFRGADIPLEIGGSDSGTTIFGTIYDGGSSDTQFNTTINGGGS